MEQPVAKYEAADLARVVERDYAPHERPQVMQMLSRYGAEPWQVEVLRVQMACLKCANGNRAALARHLDTACIDYRDVLVAAEFPRYAGARGAAALRAAIEADWQELQQWLHRA